MATLGRLVAYISTLGKLVDHMATLGILIDHMSTLHILMKGMASMATPLNMAHHSYFNLGGHQAGSQALYNHTIKTWATW